MCKGPVTGERNGSMSDCQSEWSSDPCKRRLEEVRQVDRSQRDKAWRPSITQAGSHATVLSNTMDEWRKDLGLCTGLNNTGPFILQTFPKDQQ